MANPDPDGLRRRTAARNDIDDAHDINMHATHVAWFAAGAEHEAEHLAARLAALEAERDALDACYKAVQVRAVEFLRERDEARKEATTLLSCFVDEWDIHNWPLPWDDEATQEGSNTNGQ